MLIQPKPVAERINQLTCSDCDQLNSHTEYAVMIVTVKTFSLHYFIKTQWVLAVIKCQLQYQCLLPLFLTHIPIVLSLQSSSVNRYYLTLQRAHHI